MVKELNKIKVNYVTSQNFANTMIYNVKAKLVPLPHERRERGWINCRKYIIDLTSCSTYRHFSSMCKWYLLFVNNNFVEKYVLKIVKWIYILLGSNHLGNIFAEIITIKTLFASEKPSTIANCQGEFRGLVDGIINFKIYLWSTSKAVADKEKKMGRREYKNLNTLRMERAF